MTHQKEDIINTPGHYTQGGIEPIDFIEENGFGFSEGNVHKYIIRAKYKGTELIDLEKAEYYLNRVIKEVENEATFFGKLFNQVLNICEVERKETTKFSHSYRVFKIDPTEFIEANKLNADEAFIVDAVARRKNLESLFDAKDCLHHLIGSAKNKEDKSKFNWFSEDKSKKFDELIMDVLREASKKFDIPFDTFVEPLPVSRAGNKKIGHRWRNHPVLIDKDKAKKALKVSLDNNLISNEAYIAQMIQLLDSTTKIKPDKISIKINMNHPPLKKKSLLDRDIRLIPQPLNIKPSYELIIHWKQH